ncbi:MAG: YqhA family protein, partial [Psychrobacter sp.]
MLKKFELYLEKTIFNSRWILAPFYLGLVLGIILLFIKFVQKLWYMFADILTASEASVIVDILVL